MTQRWRDIEFGDVSDGMSTNVVNPGQKTAKRILNLHNHIKPGALILRSGYEELYLKPEFSILDSFGNPVIVDMGFINFDLFFDRQAVASGQEITCLIQKAKVHGLTDISEIQNMLCFWVRPYWDGSEWIDEWDWLNKTIITKIVTGSDATYPNMIIVEGNAANGITDDSLNRFTIYNQTKDEYAKVITSKISGGYIRICHTLYNSTWDVDDVIIIGKYWLGTDYLTGLYGVDWKDISYHKILNDLRIGFGGYENRPGLSIGYRKNYFQLRSFDFPNKHADITAEGVIEAFCKTDEIALDTHILNNAYGLNLTSVSGGELEAGEKTIRLTGIINGYEEQLLAEDTILLDNDNTVEILPFVNAGQINPLITGYGIYYSGDGITFNKIFKYNLKENTYLPGSWKIDNNGRIILIKALESTDAGVLELHSEENAASDADINSTGSWTIFNGGEVTVSEDAEDNYSLKYVPDILTLPDATKRAGIIFPLDSISKGKYYSISAYLKSSSINKVYALFLGESLKPLNRTPTEILLTNGFIKNDFEAFADDLTEEPAYLALALNPGKNIYLSSNGDIYRSSDGLSWLLTNSGLPSLGAAADYFTIDLGTSVLAVSILGSAIYRSVNNGGSWTAISGTSNVSALGIVGESIFAGCNDGKILRSDDDGESFTLVNDLGTTLGVRDIANIGINIFVCIPEDGVYKSVDNGVNWVAVNSGLTSEVFVLYANATYLFAGTSDGGIFRSSNNGSTWTAINTGLIGLYISSIIEKGNYLFVATYDNGTSNGIYRSSDNGDTWEAVNTGLSTLDILDLYVFGNVILAGALTGEIFRSVDGENWIEGTGLTGYMYFQQAERISEFYVDKISIKEKSNTVFSGLADISTEMNAELGYVPTYNLVRGWDQVLCFRGRVYYLNPYVEKRYNNFLLVSNIHSNGSFMYDIASFSNFRELEKFDSNESIGMALLPTMEILILKDSSIMPIDPDTGAAREPIYGVSCISRASIVNANGIVRWCGGEDINQLNISKGFYVEPLLKGTIRDLYLALPDKASILCVRDKYNTYRLRTYKPELKTEYLLSENGWIEEKKWHFPEIYRSGFRNKLYFLSLGNIYVEKIELDYSTIEDFIMTGRYITDPPIELPPEV